MVDGSTTVTVSVISGTGQSLPECEMDALLLGRTKVSCNNLNDDASGITRAFARFSMVIFYDNFQHNVFNSPKMPFILTVYDVGGRSNGNQLIFNAVDSNISMNFHLAKMEN